MGSIRPRRDGPFFSGDSGRTHRCQCFENVAQNLARSDPRAAVEWAAEIPEPVRVKAGGEAFSVWRNSQPDAALAWWNELPATDSRRKAFLEAALIKLTLNGGPEQ